MHQLDPLVRDLMTSLQGGPRPYREVMEAWRTSCPRLTVWEDAVDLGFVERDGDMVALSEVGKRQLTNLA